jgi:nitrate reductase alpha subunit
MEWIIKFVQSSQTMIKSGDVRGALIETYREGKENKGDSLKAWENLQKNHEKRKSYQTARGKGGFRRIQWDEALEIIAAGSRFLQLFGGINLSFYDWYCDLLNASPETWGEQTDVCESADWYNAKFIAIMGANLNMTRTPDCHFFAESRHNGTKVVIVSPDFSQVSKYTDQVFIQSY